MVLAHDPSGSTYLSGLGVLVLLFGSPFIVVLVLSAFRRAVLSPGVAAVCVSLALLSVVLSFMFGAVNALTAAFLLAAVLISISVYWLRLARSSQSHRFHRRGVDTDTKEHED